MTFQEEQLFELSIQVEAYNKRVRNWNTKLPTRSGRLLMVVMKNIYDRLKSDQTLSPLEIASEIRKIAVLTKRIEKRIESIHKMEVKETQIGIPFGHSRKPEYRFTKPTRKKRV